MNGALELLGAGLAKTCNLPDNKLDKLPLLDIVNLIEQEIKFVLPDTIYITSMGI